MALDNLLNYRSLAAASLAGLLLTTGCNGQTVYEPVTYTQEGKITKVYATQREVKAISKLNEGEQGALGFVAGLTGPIGLILLGAASDVKTKVPELHMIAETDSLACDNVMPLDKPVLIETPVNVRFKEVWRVTYNRDNKETSRILYNRSCTITDNPKGNSDQSN